MACRREAVRDGEYKRVSDNEQVAMVKLGCPSVLSSVTMIARPPARRDLARPLIDVGF
jgi:hypothetical protein